MILCWVGWARFLKLKRMSTVATAERKGKWWRQKRGITVTKILIKSNEVFFISFFLFCFCFCFYESDWESYLNTVTSLLRTVGFSLWFSNSQSLFFLFLLDFCQLVIVVVVVAGSYLDFCQLGFFLGLSLLFLHISST